MSTIARLACLILLLGPTQSASQDGRDRPWTTDDAIARFEGSTGRVVCVGDVDGDGSPDVITLSRGRTTRLRCFSVRDGRLLRTLWEAPRATLTERRVHWDAGGDMDGDGFVDMVLGLPDDDRRGPGSGVVLVVSVASGEVILETHGAEPHEGHGSSVACLGDVDGDGIGDYAVGGRQCEGGKPIFDRVGASRPNAADYREGMKRRSDKPGYVVMFSGADAKQLWRVNGGTRGHAFGSQVAALGDLDGDGVRDLAALDERFSNEPARILSGATGKEIGIVDHHHGTVGDAGDVDADGYSDIFVDGQYIHSSNRTGASRIFSGRTRELLFEREFPDWYSDYSRTARLGDLDGDGHADIALGDANFHISAPGNPGYDGNPVDLDELTLGETTQLTSKPWRAFAPESGCLWILSGRSRTVMLGIYGKPGSFEGIGMQTTAVPDVSGDGWPDLVVSGYGRNYVFPGPGRGRPR